MKKLKRRVLYDNIKKLIVCIIIVSILLVCCIAVDSADNTTVSNINNTTSLQKLPKDVIIINDTYVLDKDAGIAKTDGKIYVDKTVKEEKKVPTITMWAKPSCGCRYSYTWHKKHFVDYCPHCHHYSCLRKNPKGVPEKEYTCGVCGADYCGCCGKEKYSWSRYYLKQA